MYDLKKCNLWYIWIKQFFVIDRNKEWDIYDIAEESELLFNEIYGKTKDWKNFYDFMPNKNINLYYNFKTNSFLLEIIENNKEKSNKEKDIIIETTDYLDFIWYNKWYAENKLVKQIIIDNNKINEKKILEFLKLKENEIIIDDKTIIEKNEEKFVSYNYNYKDFLYIKNLNKLIENILNKKVFFKKLKFNKEDLLDIETAFWKDILKLKNEIQGIFKSIELAKNKEIIIKSYSEIEYLYDSIWILNTEIKINKKELYMETTKQILIQYIMFYVYMKFNYMFNIINKDYYDILQLFEELKINIEIKQENEIKKLEISIY